MGRGNHRRLGRRVGRGDARGRSRDRCGGTGFADPQLHLPVPAHRGTNDGGGDQRRRAGVRRRRRTNAGVRRRIGGYRARDGDAGTQPRRREDDRGQWAGRRRRRYSGSDPRRPGSGRRREDRRAGERSVRRPRVRQCAVVDVHRAGAGDDHGRRPAADTHAEDGGRLGDRPRHVRLAVHARCGSGRDAGRLRDPAERQRRWRCGWRCRRR